MRENSVVKRFYLPVLACVAGGIVSAREIKFWTSERRSREENGERDLRVPLPILLAASPLTCPKLYFAGAYNTASYAGYTRPSGQVLFFSEFNTENNFVALFFLILFYILRFLRGDSSQSRNKLIQNLILLTNHDQNTKQLK